MSKVIGGWNKLNINTIYDYAKENHIEFLDKEYVDSGFRHKWRCMEMCYLFI